MIKYLDLLSETEFFKEIPKDVILEYVYSEACYLKSYQAGNTIYGYKQPISHAGIILEGNVDIIHPSIHGQDTIVSRLSCGHVFGASFACVDNLNTLNDMRSITDSVILFVNIHTLLHIYYHKSKYSLQLIENIMHSLAQSNIRLNTKIQVLSQKSLRDKLLTYFELSAKQAQSSSFTLPFNREQLASYLGSERSSVCRELSKLVEDQLIELSRDQVVLL